MHRVPRCADPVVGAAFLRTLRVGLGVAYTDEVDAAYTAMWGIVEATMLAGAAEADGPPPGGWGCYSVPETAALMAATKQSIVSAQDWYSNPVVTARGSA